MDFSGSLHRGQIHARRRADPKCQAPRGFPTSLSLPPAARLHFLQGRGPNGTLCFHVKWPPEPGALPAKRHSRDNPASPGLQRPGPGKTSLSAQRGPGLAGQNHRAGCGSRLPLWGIRVLTCSRVDGRRWLQFRCRLWPRGGALAPPLLWDPTVLPLPVGAASPGPWPERPTSCSPRTSSSAVATSDRRGPPQARVSFQDRG